ncbi:PREDICTED: zinc transporter ZIP1-like, partial [Ficedula albicollis]|uniref:zinc transporter ZIP1-like n=1 Tax=Ficedula albicollis TaxID=59894 RepID=UPI0007AD8A9C
GPPPDPRSPVLSLVSCFSGGVFMGTFLLDLLPDYLSSIAAALEGLRITLQFPLPEFILAMGFFLVLVLEGGLEGLAAGTFLFVTFLEILPQELGVPRNRIPKVILILAGFALVSAILFVKG